MLTAIFFYQLQICLNLLSCRHSNRLAIPSGGADLIRRLLLLLSLTLVVTIPSFAGGSLCDAISGNLVLNCGFEDATKFADWTTGGNFEFADVDPSSAHSGNLGVQVGPVDRDGSLSQVITDTAGAVSLDFWLANLGGSPNDFSVLWDGVVVSTADTPVTDASPFTYTEQGPVTLTSTGSDTLEFLFRQDNDYWLLDDVSVVQTPEPGSILLLITVVGLCGIAFKKRGARNAA